jgi:hypothetical protein
VSDQCRDSYCASIIEIADIQRLKWVNNGLSRPTAATSAFMGKADIQCPLSGTDAIFPR